MSASPPPSLSLSFFVPANPKKTKNDRNEPIYPFIFFYPENETGSTKQKKFDCYAFVHTFFSSFYFPLLYSRLSWALLVNILCEKPCVNLLQENLRKIGVEYLMVRVVVTAVVMTLLWTKPFRKDINKSNPDNPVEHHKHQRVVCHRWHPLFPVHAPNKSIAMNREKWTRTSKYCKCEAVYCVEKVEWQARKQRVSLTLLLLQLLFLLRGKRQIWVCAG